MNNFADLFLSVYVCVVTGRNFWPKKIKQKFSERAHDTDKTRR